MNIIYINNVVVSIVQMGPVHSSTNISGLSLPLDAYLSLENEYLESVNQGDSKVDTFKRLEKAYREQSAEHDRLFITNRQMTPSTLITSNPTSTSKYHLDISIANQQQHTVYSSPRPSTIGHHMSPYSPINLSPRIPLTVSSSRSKLRPRPRSAVNVNPNRIDRDVRSLSPRRSHSIEPVLKMSFETLWNIAWVSTSARLLLEPLPITDYPNIQYSPIVENNYELVLLIYLLRSLSREFEGQVRWKIRLLCQKSAVIAGGSVIRANSSSSRACGPMPNCCSAVSLTSQQMSVHAHKSYQEQSLLATLRLMEECHLFLDTFFATVTPRNGSWRDEMDAILKIQLQKQETGKNASLLGSTCSLAFHLLRSIETIVVGTKPSSHLKEIEYERVTNKGPGAKRGLAAERQKAKADSKRGDKRPLYHVLFLPIPVVSIMHSLRRLVDCAFLLLEERFHRLSDFDTFELIAKAIDSLLSRVVEDVMLIKEKTNKAISLLEACIDARWRSGPICFNLVGEADIESELSGLSKELNILLQEAVHRFSFVDINTLRKLNPSRLTLAELQDTSHAHHDSKRVNIDAPSVNSPHFRHNHSSIAVAKQILRESKAAGLTHNTPMPEWELRPGKLKKLLRSTISNLEVLFTLLISKNKIVSNLSVQVMSDRKDMSPEADTEEKSSAVAKDGISSDTGFTSTEDEEKVDGHISMKEVTTKVEDGTTERKTEQE